MDQATVIRCCKALGALVVGNDNEEEHLQAFVANTLQCPIDTNEWYKWSKSGQKVDFSTVVPRSIGMLKQVSLSPF